jgi:hypothetical protein
MPLAKLTLAGLAKPLTALTFVATILYDHYFLLAKI